MQCDTLSLFDVSEDAVDVEELAGRFPFVDGFEDVVLQRVGCDYLRRLKEAMGIALDDVTTTIESKCGEDVSAMWVHATLLVACLARVDCALAYAVEIEDVEISRRWLVKQLDAEWLDLVVDEDVVPAVITGFTRFSVVALLKALLLPLQVPSVTDKCKKLGEICVVLPAGDCEVGDVSADRMVLTLDDYRGVMGFIRDQSINVLACDPEEVRKKTLSGAEVSGRYVEPSELAEMVWAVVSGVDGRVGYCYQWLVPWWRRFVLCEAFGAAVLHDRVNKLLMSFGTWSRGLASCVLSAATLHVKSPGLLPVGMVLCGKMVGIQESDLRGRRVDSHAKVLIDNLIARHKVLPPMPPPADENDVDIRSMSDSSEKARVLRDITYNWFAGAGEVVSPRPDGNLDRFGDGARRTRRFDAAKDDQRKHELLERMTYGAVVDEHYFDRSASRMRRIFHRPKLMDSVGRSFHLFDSCTGETGGASATWWQDVSFDVPGWVSYCRQFPFRSEEYAVEFRPPESEDAAMFRDIRVDCSGRGTLTFVVASAPVRDTVFWFSESVRFSLATEGSVHLRVSYPLSGRAMAMPAAARRYMSLPASALQCEVFEVRRFEVDKTVVLKRDNANAAGGAAVFRGHKDLNAGTTRIGFQGLNRRGHVRLLVGANGAVALKSVVVGGVTFEVGVKGRVNVVCDLAAAPVRVSLDGPCRVAFSVLVIERPDVFDTAVSEASNTGVV